MALLAGCTRCNPLPSPIPPPQPGSDDAGLTDAGRVADSSPWLPDASCGGVATCATACCRLRQLGCSAGSGSPTGDSCKTICEAYQAGPTLGRWNLAACVSATSCGQCR